jgi:hypothetical protein
LKGKLSNSHALEQKMVNLGAVAPVAAALVASVVVYRASGMRPVWSIVTAVIVVLVLAMAAFAILMLAKARAFP